MSTPRSQQFLGHFYLDVPSQLPKIHYGRMAPALFHLDGLAATYNDLLYLQDHPASLLEIFHKAAPVLNGIQRKQ